jgi:hypothetical protein
MGLTLHALERDVARQLGFDEEDEGLLVLDVEKNSPLTADLRLYDLIEEVGRKRVRSIDDSPQIRVIIWKRQETR